MEHLLDVAEAVFEEVGYDAATTNLIAARAEVPVGTLYRWFPDKAALAEALTDRYLTDLVRVYDDVVAELRPEDPIGDFVRRVMASLVSQTRHQRALPALLVSTMVPGGRSAAGRRLRSGLADHIRDLVERITPSVLRSMRRSRTRNQWPNHNLTADTSRASHTYVRFDTVTLERETAACTRSVPA